MKYISLLLLCFLSVSFVSAQEVYNSSGRPAHALKQKKQKGYDPSRLILGSGVGGDFGTGYANFTVSPMVGYRFTDRFSAGIGIGYQYLSFEQVLYNQNTGLDENYPTKANIFYPSVWGRYFVWRNVFLSGTFEYDMMNFKDYYYDNNSNIVKEQLNVGVPCLLMGVGVRQPVGGRISVIFEALYDVLQQQYSPYLNEPQFRLGVCAGL